MELIKKVCTVCNKPFFTDKSFYTRCDDCFKNYYVSLCLACGKPLTSFESQNGAHKYHNACFARLFKKTDPATEETPVTGS